MASIVGLGYNSSVKLGSYFIFCTSLSINVGSQVIVSQGAFGRSSSSSGSNLYAFGPMRQDYPDIQATVSFQATTDNIKQILGWIKNRTSLINLSLYTGGTLSYNGYWTNISFSVSQGQLLTVSMTLMIIDSHRYGTNNIGMSNSISNKMTDNIGKMKGEATIIPYYLTMVENLSVSEPVLSWSLDLSQNINKKTYCASTTIGTDAPIPKDLIFGVLNSTLKVNVLMVSSSIQLQGTRTINYANASLTSNKDIKVWFDNLNYLILKYNILQSVVPSVTDQSGLQQIQYTYLSHLIEITTPPSS